MGNVQVADILDEIADLLEIEDAGELRVRAYRSAARTVRELPHRHAAAADAEPRPSAMACDRVIEARRPVAPPGCGAEPDAETATSPRVSCSRLRPAGPKRGGFPG